MRARRRRRAGGRADPPELTAEPDGTYYYTTHDLCGGELFIPFTTSHVPAGDGICGDGHLDPGEDNRNDGLCTVAYKLVLVAHDASGNPRAVPEVVRAKPNESLEPLSGAPEDAGCGCRTGERSWPVAGVLRAEYS